MNTFTFNNRVSSAFSIYIGGQGSFNAPKKKITKISIPGRNGDLIFDDGTFENVNVTYNIVGVDNFKSHLSDIKEWLENTNGYAVLEDTYNPDYYRLGIVENGVEFIMSRLNKSGRAKVIFNCKPQRFLKSGDTKTTLTTAGSVTNPTNFNSRPIITVYGSGAGTVTIRNQVISLDPIYTKIVIDSETQDCYNGSSNKNSAVSLGTGGFPVLVPGSNAISFSGGVTKVEIQGKWWTL